MSEIHMYSSQPQVKITMAKCLKKKLTNIYKTAGHVMQNRKLAIYFSRFL